MKPAAWLMVPLLAGCSGPLSALAPEGPAAAQIAMLWWGMLIGAAVITLFVLALVWRAFAAPPGEASERLWIKGFGIYLSLAILTVTVGAGIWVGERLQPRPADRPVTVIATGSQWQWRFVQTAPGGAQVETLNRLHIPAGQPVDVLIRTDDVIHSFWVPRLAGKMDAMPGRTNILRIAADRPGLYSGRSAEFSGVGYAAMTFDVLVYDPAAPPAFTDRDQEAAP
ncbi:cytochrome c oxidase subunit II [Ketogulonicigenium vulgare]|nr:hypothetical protein [Ketogulonicigenium vulgare]ALJ80272.1 hypothetical protein KVH_03225 [Ketogulonicigenium vulgare]